MATQKVTEELSEEICKGFSERVTFAMDHKGRVGIL